MTNVSTSSRRAFGLHIYVYFWLAFAGLGVACLFAVTFPIRDVEMPEFAFLALLTTPFLFWAVLSWSLWRNRCLAGVLISGEDRAGRSAVGFPRSVVSINAA